MIKVVIDTNVLVSALLFDGTPGKLVTLWKRNIYCLMLKGNYG
jgi:predicted nucleic acid-binding protein